MALSADLIREHVEQGESFARIGVRYSVDPATVHYQFHKAAKSELDALEAHLRAGGIDVDVPLDPIEEFQRHLRRLHWVIQTLYEERGLMLKIRQEQSFAVAHFTLELL
jgi:hypothetical protein